MKKARSGRIAQDDYRSMLLARRIEVAASLGSQQGGTAEWERLNEEDQAQQSNEEFVSVRVNYMDWEQLKLVDEALDRLSAGDYGVCLECEQPIPPKRLQAIPWARYCVSCQENRPAAPLEVLQTRELLSQSSFR
jgi:DnaK suppressor protein